MKRIPRKDIHTNIGKNTDKVNVNSINHVIIPPFFEKEFNRTYSKRDDEFMDKIVKNKFVILNNSNITKLRDFINEIKKKFIDRTSEFEIRLQNINKLNFDTFKNIIEREGFFKKKSITKFITKTTKDNIRIHQDDKNNIFYCEQKKETDRMFLNLSNNKIKFSFSYENILDLSTVQQNIVLERQKERTRYEFNEYYIDTTIVTNMDKSKTYEIEIEFKSIPEINNVLLPVKYILFSINKQRLSLIDIDYEYEIRNLYQNLIKDITNSKLKHTFSIYENKPRNIKLEDISNKDKLDYSVTNKLNGVNFFLFFSKEKEKIFIFNKTKFEYINVSNISNKLSKLDNILNDFLIQGELYEDENLNKVLYIFDSIMVNGLSMINKPHTERISEFTKYNNIFEDILSKGESPINIKIKKFYGFDTNLYDEFIKCKNSLQKNKEGNIDYEINDGFIFTPINEPYINTNTLKYKFPETMTIDFLIKLQNKSDNFKVFNLFIYNDKNEIVQFEPLGTNKKYIMISEKERDGKLFDNLKDNMIIECKFHNDIFIPYRIRDDKTMPNFINVANDVFNDILHPITLSDLEETLKKNYVELNKDIIVENNQDNIEINNSIETVIPFEKLELNENIFNIEYNSLLECIFSNISEVYINSDEGEKIKILNSAYEYFGEDENKINDIKLMSETFQVNIFHITLKNNIFYILDKHVINNSKNNIYFM